jgi:hypothetical protein
LAVHNAAYRSRGIIVNCQAESADNHRNTVECLEDPNDHPFCFIDPPFQFNAPGVSRYPPEVTGYRLLTSMARRLGWSSLAQKRILDFGCGVRFTRTIVNLGLDVGCYTGVDVNLDSINWLRTYVVDSRLSFEHIHDQNSLYNPEGNPEGDYSSLKYLSAFNFDVACMFSVITHQRPREAKRTFAILRELMHGQGQMYFTAFLSRDISDYGEPAEQVGLMSTYHPDYLVGLLDQSGWHTDRIYKPSSFQQFAFACHC